MEGTFLLAKVESSAVNGIDGYMVEIEVDLGGNFPSFDIVGLPDAAVKEAKDRVRAAIRNSNFHFHEHRIVINLAPANIKKEGSGFDLPIAIGILAAQGEIKPERIGDTVFVGELALDGKIRPVNGLLSMAIAAKAAGKKYLVHPVENLPEVAIITGITAVPTGSLKEVTAFLNAVTWTPPLLSPVASTHEIDFGVEEDDLADVKGQEQAKRALEVAAAGGHNIFSLE